MRMELQRSRILSGAPFITSRCRGSPALAFLWMDNCEEWKRMQTLDSWAWQPMEGDFFFLAATCGLWDLSSLTRDWTQARGSEKDILTSGALGKSLVTVLKDTRALISEFSVLHPVAHFECYRGRAWQGAHASLTHVHVHNFPKENSEQGLADSRAPAALPSPLPHPHTHSNPQRRTQKGLDNTLERRGSIYPTNVQINENFLHGHRVRC